MKKFTTLFQTGFVLVLFAFVSCSTDDSNTNEPPNPSDLKLFVIDTAKVNTISTLGTNEVTILNKMVNSSSYIADFSISPDGKKFIYVNHQMTGTFPNFVTVREIRKANSDGSGDVKIYEEMQSQTEIQSVRYCSDGKIVFSTVTYQAGFVAVQTHLMNEDGTGLTDVQYAPNYTDVTDDRGYYLVNNETGIQIFDADADNGAPGLYHTENMSTSESIGNGVFTNDGKYAVIPYKESGVIKAKIIDMAAKTSSNIDLITGLDSGWISYHLEMSSDGKRGVITISGSDYDKSKTYVFNIKTGIVNAPFENNDDTVSKVYAW